MDSSECCEDKSGTKLSSYVTYCGDPVKVSSIIREKITNFNEEEYFIVLGVDGGKKIIWKYVSIGAKEQKTMENIN